MSWGISVSHMSKDFQWYKIICGIVSSLFFFEYILTQILDGVVVYRISHLIILGSNCGYATD